MTNLVTLHSNLDASVNFVHLADSSITESRFVQRHPDYFIAYISSHNGCNKACRFCHLTRTGQTSFDPASTADMYDQANHVLKYYGANIAKQNPAHTVHYNWMARGEPLSNPSILNDFGNIRERLLVEAFNYNLHSKFKISSIFPREAGETNISKNFDYPDLEFYYSLYSTNNDFRRKWLPNAQDYKTSLRQLADWQQHTSNTVALHQTFIENENDSEQSIIDLINVVQEFGLATKFNLVRYNSYDTSKYGQESSINVINRNMNLLSQAFGQEFIKIVPRVGLDSKCSCGMFVTSTEVDNLIHQ